MQKKRTENRKTASETNGVTRRGWEEEVAIRGGHRGIARSGERKTEEREKERQRRETDMKSVKTKRKEEKVERTREKEREGGKKKGI